MACWRCYHRRRPVSGESVALICHRLIYPQTAPVVEARLAPAEQVSYLDFLSGGIVAHLGCQLRVPTEEGVLDSGMLSWFVAMTWNRRELQV